MVGQADDEQSPLVGSFSSYDESSQLLKRTGTTWTAVAHIITGVIGAGVLSLSWSVAQLGWIAGPLLMIVFAAITTVSTYLISDCYRYPDPQLGPARCPSYMEAVRLYLGEKWQYVCGVFVQQSLYGCGIAYTITAASSISFAWRLIQERYAIALLISFQLLVLDLSLVWSKLKFGWIGRPVCLLCLQKLPLSLPSSLLIVTSLLTLKQGREITPYSDAIRVSLSGLGLLVAVIFEHVWNQYAIIRATSTRAIQRSTCNHKEGNQAECSSGENLYMLLFGALQIVVSQIPDLHNMAWLSAVAAIMSFTYASIGFALGLTKVIENGTIHGSITGVPSSSIANKLSSAFQAIGDIAFAYPYSVILLEIQDTLKSPPAESQTMKKASVIAIFVTTAFYLCCGCFGYAAFGNDTPGNLLTGFEFFEPYWLIDFANACIVLHLVGGYQIYSQPVFAVVERWFSSKYPNSEFVNKLYSFKLPWLPVVQLNSFRLCFRTAYVVSTTGISMMFPYFNQVLGVSGALSFWPMAIHFPVEMYFVQRKIGAWTRKWILLRTFSFICFLVTVMGVIGSLEGLLSAKFS